MKKRHFKNAALVTLSFICLLFIYINVHPETKLFIIRDLPIVKGFQKLSEQSDAMNFKIQRQGSQLASMNEEIEALEKQEALHKENTNKIFVLRSGYAIELLESDKTHDLVSEEKYKMIDRGLDFTFAVLNDDSNIIKKLCTSGLFEEYRKSKEIEYLSLENETQRLFHDLKDKTLSKFQHISAPFIDESRITPQKGDYTLIIHYYCNDFDDGKIIIQVLYFEKVNGEYLIAAFGRDA